MCGMLGISKHKKAKFQTFGLNFDFGAEQEETV